MVAEFPIRTILTIFDLPATMMLPTTFPVIWSFDSGEEGKNRFSRWRPFGHLGFPIEMILAIFDLQVTPTYPTKTSDPDASYPVSSRLAFLFRRRSEKYDGHLGFPMRMSLAISDLPLTPMLPTKFQVNLPFGSKEAKNRSLRWPPWQLFWIFDQNNFSYF